jgi:hypothetical protein
MQFALVVVKIECFFLKHDQGVLGIKPSPILSIHIFDEFEFNP